MEPVNKIIASLKKEESVSLLMPPLVVKEPLIKKLWQRAGNWQKQMEIVDLRNLEELSLTAFLKLLPKKLEKKILILADADLLFSLGTSPFLRLALSQEKFQTVFLFLFSQNILSERLRSRFYKITLLFENIFYWPLEPNKLPFKNKIMAENFLACFEETQREVLRLLIRNLPVENLNWQLEAEYLQKIGLIKKVKSGFKFISPLISQAALSLPELRLEKLRLKKKRILMGKHDLSFSFSPFQQKLLRLLLRKKGQIVSREQIGKKLWGRQYFDYYSDWAIDQLVFKLKKKLEKLWINPKIILTVKKKGFSIKV